MLRAIDENIPLIIGVSLVILFILVFVLFRPAITGFSVKGDLKELNISPSEYSSALNVLNEQKDLVEQELQASTDALHTAQEQWSAEKGVFENNILSLNNKINHLEELNEGLRDSSKEYLDGFDELLKNSARTICCKAKVDDGSIDGYDVVQNKISCSSEGEYELSC